MKKFQVTGKLEINLLNSKTDPGFISNFLVKNRVPAVVTAPEYIVQLVTHRAACGGRYKIICALDFPKGNRFALDKIYHSHPDLAAADGYEVLLTSGRSGVESRNEMKAIYEFLKMHNRLLDIRWCINAFSMTDEQIVTILKNMEKYPPSFVRIGSDLVTPRASVEEQLRLVELAKKYVPFPIKVCGNIKLNTVDSMETVKRFDATLLQAEALVKEVDKLEKAAVSEV